MTLDHKEIDGVKLGMLSMESQPSRRRSFCRLHFAICLNRLTVGRYMQSFLAVISSLSSPIAIAILSVVWGAW